MCDFIACAVVKNINLTHNAKQWKTEQKWGKIHQIKIVTRPGLLQRENNGVKGK